MIVICNYYTIYAKRGVLSGFFFQTEPYIIVSFMFPRGIYTVTLSPTRRRIRGSTRAINLFKCYSEIISEHDRILREFKFVGRDFQTCYTAYHVYGIQTASTTAPSNVCIPQMVSNTHCTYTHTLRDGRAVHYYANLGISRTPSTYTHIHIIYDIVGGEEIPRIMF